MKLGGFASSRSGCKHILVQCERGRCCWYTREWVFQWRDSKQLHTKYQVRQLLKMAPDAKSDNARKSSLWNIQEEIYDSKAFMVV
jgi:hypothetical protein